MSLRNSSTADLSVAQIAAHLQVAEANIGRNLKLGGPPHNQPGRLPGYRTFTEGAGRGGPWRVKRSAYLDFLRIPEEDRDPAHLDPDGLPPLLKFEQAAAKLGCTAQQLRIFIRRRRMPHIAFGRTQYLTRNQYERIRVLAENERWDLWTAAPDPRAQAR